MSMEKPDLSKAKGMVIAGIFSSQCVDGSGERVLTRGIDITSMVEGKAGANYEHISTEKGVGREILGTVIYVHKVLTYADAEDDLQKDLWKRNREKPYLFGMVRLYDAAGHETAKNVAAMIRDSVAHKDPLRMDFSIEGSTLTREGNDITESIARAVALTIKPACKAAVSELILDPNAPSGYEKVDNTEMLKAEVFADPMYRKIGKAVEQPALVLSDSTKPEQDPQYRLIKNLTTIKTLKKALTAGTAEGAPSTLTQGAALQREDLGRIYKGSVLAAIRDYDDPWDREKFKKHLKESLAKANLPEVSDSYINHFVDVAEATKLKKSVELAKSENDDLIKKETAPVLSNPDESVIEEKRDKIPATAKFLTFRGKKLKATPNQKPDIDVNKGILRTPYGSFRLHNPATEAPEVAKHFTDLLNSPHTKKIMSEALKNWHKVHLLNKAGELPEEIPMTATILSTCSGNRPVPLAELQTVRIVDAIRNSGIDPREQGFENILPHLRRLDKPDVLPETGKKTIKGKLQYFKESGELRSINPLLNDTVNNLSKYYKAHSGLVDLVSQHKTDMQAAIKTLMDHKRQKENWQKRRAEIIKETGEDPGEYKGLNIPGIKLKTGLYAYGMMGGGSSIVPDTHFIRHMLGLDVKKDADTLKYLKNLFWSPTNYHLIEKYNDWYRKSHPAFQWMAKHPEFGKYFEDPKDATFPAFWANWINVPAYESILGMSGNKAKNQGSTHAPYWAAIEPYVNKALKRLGKSEDFDTTMPLRAALIMQQYVKDYGEIPAQILYYTHLVPKLLECAQNRQNQSDAMEFLRKSMRLESQLIELRKDMRHVTEGGHSVELPEVYKVDLTDGKKNYPAGRFMVSKGKLYHLEDYRDLLNKLVPAGDVDASTISKIHGLMASPNFDVQQHEVDLPEQEVKQQPLVPTVIKAPEPKRDAVFSYFRLGMAKPHIVEFNESGAALDGQEITQDELALMLENARKGLAIVKWGANLQKSEALLKHDLEDTMSDDEALQHVRAAVAEGHLHPSVERALTKHLYEDRMVPGIGNKHAAQVFRSKGKPGTYASIDLNDFKHVNDTHGHDAGDEAIKSFGSALRSAADKAGNIKVFRTGGDEFSVHSPTYEHMANFLRHAREHVDALPAIGGTHKPSFSVGLGHNFPKADEAMYVAKSKKLDPITHQRLYQPGQTPHLGHSLYPRQEGELFQQETVPPKVAVG